MPSAPAPATSASAKPRPRRPVVRTDVLGEVDRGGEVGTTECRTQEPDHHPADPGRDDRDRQRAPPPVDVVDPGAGQRAHQGRDDERQRGDHDARLAEAGQLLLDHAVGRLVARGCTSCAPLALASVVSSASRASRSVPPSYLTSTWGTVASPPRSSTTDCGHEQHREAARRGHDLLLALRREQVLGREADADDFEWPGGADPERLDRRRPGATSRSSAVCCSTTATEPVVMRSKSCPAVIERSLTVAPVAGTPMIVPWTLVLPLRMNTESVVVPRVFAACTPSTAWRRDDGIGVATDHGQVGEVGLGVEVVERRVEVVDGRAQPDEHRDTGRDEQCGEDESQPMTGGR